MSEEIAREMMCAGEEPKGPPEKQPFERPTRKVPEPPAPCGPPPTKRDRYPAFEPPEPWPEPSPPKPDKGRKNG